MNRIVKTALAGLAFGLGGAAASLIVSQTGVLAQAQPSTAANIKLIQDYYAAYGSGDLNRLRPFFADNIRWMIPGEHPLAGMKIGKDEVVAFFAQLNKGGFGAEPIAFAADGEWVIDLHRGFSTKGVGKVDTTWALAFKIRNNQIVEAVNFSLDQAAANKYFWDNYPLKSIPERLR